jgi:alanine racemase
MRHLLSEIAAVCGGTLVGSDGAVSRVIVDSRSERRQRDSVNETLFVAIRTSNRDGAAFVGELYARGVRGFLVGGDFAGAADFPEAGFVRVSDTVQALQKLAAHYRSGFTGKVVGITGSYGKTIVKEWIAQLAPAGVTLFRSPKSWNSQIGVPLSVLMATGDEDYIVIEAGISQPGEMAKLQKIIRPDIGILTSIGGAHEDNFTSLDKLRAEKMILFRDCPEVLSGDKEGSFEKRNAALAVAFWKHEGYNIPQKAIAALEPVALRLEVKEGIHNSIIINDTYHSDAPSLAIALDHLARVAGDRPRIVIMSGGNAEATKLVKTSGAERIIEITPEFTIGDALQSLTSSDIEGRAILIKGGSRLGFDRLSRALERRSHTTVMEVDLDAMIRNLHLCRQRLSPGVGIIPMIKADGYGHGIFEMARTLEAQGVDYLAVAFADEGVALREAGITMPIVVLNADADSFEPMIGAHLEPEIYNFTALREFVALVKRHGEQHYPIHIKLDTGMHRLGFSQTEIPELTAALADADRYVRVATIFSHLATADDPTEDDFTRGQIARFDNMSREVVSTMPYPVRRHLANTNGIERFPEAQFDLVRLGIGLYGFGMQGAQPVASLRTRIVHIAEYAAGETIGYSRRGVLIRPSRIATIPIGYADGLDRRLSNGAWSVLVNGKDGRPHPAPIIGNVCMDSCMIDITYIDGVQVGGEVTIFSARERNTATDMATILDTIPYEVLTSISARVKRVYMRE